ncbi:MAG: hypothetical protein IH784_03860 [Bacteroidetes bacterium]|nr:hypothetical protein [Bacteroidota bacterium]
MQSIILNTTVQVTTIDLYIHNFLATTKIVFIFSTALRHTFITSRYKIYISILSASPESSLQSKITEPEELLG